MRSEAPAPDSVLALLPETSEVLVNVEIFFHHFVHPVMTREVVAGTETALLSDHFPFVSGPVLFVGFLVAGASAHASGLMWLVVETAELSGFVVSS